MEALNFVKPVRPAAPYIGGKRNLSRRLVAIIDATDHAAYAEPFVGMGGVFLRRTRRPRCEVINDISENVTTFFRILQRHYVAFMDMLRFQLTTRAGFERLMRTDPSTLTDLERAARFLYLQRTTFGGKVAGRNFGVDVHGPARFDVTKLGQALEDLHERLASVVIERMPFEAFIARYDRPGTLFYIDPPYWGSEKDYGAGVFAPEDFARLAVQLAGVAGKFILSINDVPAVREIFAAFQIVEVDTTYTVSGKAQRASELIISNFKLA
ncbi:MAG: DNA methyltransferase [Sphingobium sp. 66-54]|nr:MAG: DNA methyltransferase [Sphingobium sp. 66-54]